MSCTMYTVALWLCLCTTTSATIGMQRSRIIRTESKQNQLSLSHTESSQHLMAGMKMYKRGEAVHIEIVKANASSGSEEVAVLKQQMETLRKELKRLRVKVEGNMIWNADPFLSSKLQYKCKEMKFLGDHAVCLDALKKDSNCLVYDFGIRDQAGFSQELVEGYGCHARMFDPSPVSQEWWASDRSKPFKDSDHYDFHSYGAGGEDGKVELFEYDWDQVSLVQAPPMMDPVTHKVLKWDSRRKFKLPVKTLSTIMHDMGDSFVDVMKLDVEGSEYVFMQDVFDRQGCPPAKQLILEWHHFSLDRRYGSSPELNLMTRLLNECGFQTFYTRDHWLVGDMQNPPRGMAETGYVLPERYTLAAYICPSCGPSSEHGGVVGSVLQAK